MCPRNARGTEVSCQQIYVLYMRSTWTCTGIIERICQKNKTKITKSVKDVNIIVGRKAVEKNTKRFCVYCSLLTCL